MLVVPPTYVKRDGIQYRIDGVSGNFVFMHSQHGKNFVMNIGTGSLLLKNYHPITLATVADMPIEVIEGVLDDFVGFEGMKGFTSKYFTLESMKVANQYLVNLSRLLDLSCRGVLSVHLIPIVEAMVRGVPARELHQGIKSLYSVDIPKVVVNYLSGGYQMELTLEELLRMVREEGSFNLVVDEAVLTGDSAAREES